MYLLINHIQLYHYCSLKVDILVSVKISGRNQIAKCFVHPPLWKKPANAPECGAFIGTVTRTPIELRLRYNPEPGAVWSGRLQCKNDSGQRHSARLHDQTEVSDAIQRGLFTKHELAAIIQAPGCGATVCCIHRRLDTKYIV